MPDQHFRPFMSHLHGKPEQVHVLVNMACGKSAACLVGVLDEIDIAPAQSAQSRATEAGIEAKAEHVLPFLINRVLFG